MTCSSPDDCAEIERRLASGNGLLTHDGASRGNLFSGEADAMILTVSRMGAEKKANPGYRAFLANGFNVTRLLVLFLWEALLEKVYAIRQRRRKVWPRGYRGGRYPFLRAALCVGVRDLIVFGVLTDMMRGRPAVYATFSSYDEVAHHSGLERPDTLEALRKLDQQFGRIERARRFAPRPYELVVLSDHGQTQGATFKQRNGYDLEEFVERSIATGKVARRQTGDENDAAVGHAVAEATGRVAGDGGGGIGEDDVIVLASGNLGLIYLMDERRRLYLEEIDERHPRLLESLRRHPHIGFLLVRSTRARRGRARRERDPVPGRRHASPARIRWRPSHPAPRLTCGGPTASSTSPTSWSTASTTPKLEQGCAFEELISFHGGLGGPQTRPFILHPVGLPMPPQPIVGASAVHDVLLGWRRSLQGEPADEPAGRGRPPEQPPTLPVRRPVG